MKNHYTFHRLLLIIIALVTIHYGQAQTCASPNVLIFDDIESLTPGDASGQAPHWGQWPGAMTGAIVTDEQASSGTQSIKIDANETGQDVLLLLGEQTTGHFILKFDLYVPSGNSAYFNLQHELPTESSGFWAAEFFFDNDGEGSFIFYDGSTYFFDYREDQWFNVQFLINIDEDIIRLIIGDFTVFAWTFSSAFNDPSNVLSAVNFFPSNANSLYYVDDINFWQIPAAEEGKYCYTAVELDAPGTYFVPELSCFGGGYDLGGGDGAEKGYWFTYTPDEDGYIAISSCGKGVDTRGWIFTGEDCKSLLTVGVNDDRCELLPNGSEWATYREAVVTAGTKYYIMWDNAWAPASFDFDLIFSSDDPTPGNFCQTAIPVTPGEEIGLEEFDGEAAVAGPIIGTSNPGAGITPTSYVKSEWYSFTPPSNGLVTITSCEGASGLDTRVWVYTGDCTSFESLDLVASNDDGCEEGELTSMIDSLEVTAGTTYYIEWDNGWDDVGFLWMLLFESTAAEVTFQVDMSQTTVDPGGVFLAGSFNGWSNDNPMEDPDEDMIYTLTLPLNANTTYEYKFKNGPDGWESFSGDCTTGNDNNRFVEVGEDNITLDAVCFNSCVACVSAVDDAALAAGVTLFPNPAGEQLNLRFDLPERAENLRVRLLNHLGQPVYERYLGAWQKDLLEIQTGHLPAGVYLVNISDNDGQLTKSIIIE